MRLHSTLVLAALGALGAPVLVDAQDFFGCELALQSLSSSATSASFDASSAEDACRDAESSCDNYRSCRSFPDIYDLLDDNCQSKQFECQSDTQRCGSAKSSLELSLSSVESSLASVQLSCGYAFERDPNKAIKKLEEMLRQLQEK